MCTTTNLPNFLFMGICIVSFLKNYLWQLYILIYLNIWGDKSYVSFWNYFIICVQVEADYQKFNEIKYKEEKKNLPKSLCPKNNHIFFQLLIIRNFSNIQKGWKENTINTRTSTTSIQQSKPPHFKHVGALFLKIFLDLNTYRYVSIRMTSQHILLCNFQDFFHL